MRCALYSRCGRHGVTLSSLLLGRRWNTPATSASCQHSKPAITSAAAVLPGVDLARRAVSPSQEFPATWSDDEPLSPSDPRVHWREHYSLDAEKPYYQNIKTMEVTWEIPEGFVTRFPRLYSSNGYHVDVKGAVFRSSSSSASGGYCCRGDGGGGTAVAKGSEASALSLKQRLAAYGAGGLFWYLIVHNLSLGCVFICLYVFRIDLIGFACSYGFAVKHMDEVPLNDNKPPPFWKTFVLSIILNKILVPLHLIVTVTSAPYLVPRLEPIATRLCPKMKAFARRLLGRGTCTGTAAKV